MSTRKRKSHIAYEQYRKTLDKNQCQFCTFSLEDQHVLHELKAFWIVKNIFPYDIWDNSSVVNHLMLVPKRHIDSIAHFDHYEREEYVEVLAKYEGQGFSIYARAPGNIIKSVVHQHTHLIKIDNSIKKFMLFSSRPRFLITK